MDRKFAINLQDYMERYFQYVYDLCKKRFSSWEMREAYLGGLESTRTLNNSLQLQNVQHAVKLYPDIIDNFCNVYNNYMGKDTDCRVQKKRHLFQFFLQEFLCEMSAKLIRKQSTEKTVREIMSLLSADDRRATVDFCIQKALSSTAKYDIEIIGDILTSDDSISSIGSTPTPFNDMRRKEMEKYSKISRNSGLTESQLKNIAPSASPSLPPEQNPPQKPSALPSSIVSSSPSAIKPPVAVESVVRSATSVPQSVQQSVASDAQSDADSVSQISQASTNVSKASTKISQASTNASKFSKASQSVQSVASSLRAPTQASELSDSESEPESSISLDYSKKKQKPQVGLMARINKPRIDDSDDDSEDEDISGSSVGSDTDSGSEVSQVKPKKRQPPAKKKKQKSPVKKKPLTKNLSLSKNKRY
jgi:hypothetical protein